MAQGQRTRADHYSIIIICLSIDTSDALVVKSRIFLQIIFWKRQVLSDTVSDNLFVSIIAQCLTL